MTEVEKYILHLQEVIKSQENYITALEKYVEALEQALKRRSL